MFDFFGVIATADPYEVWLRDHGYTRRDEFLAASQALDSGQIALGEFYDRLSTLSGQPAASIRRGFVVTINQEVVELINRLRPRYQVGLLSNASSELLRPLLQEHNLEPLFREIIISGEVGVAKPDPRIFNLALERVKVGAEEAVFIDDLPQYVEAAENIGMTGLQFAYAKQLISDLQKLGVDA